MIVGNVTEFVAHGDQGFLLMKGVIQEHTSCVGEFQRDAVEMWLKNDARIADIRRQEGAVYYLTNDRVLVLRPMYNAPGYAYDDEDSNKERGKTTKLASNTCGKTFGGGGDV